MINLAKITFRRREGAISGPRGVSKRMTSLQLTGTSHIPINLRNLQMQYAGAG